MERITPGQSNRIWMLKAVAIFTVFFAHMPWSGDNPFMHKLYCLNGIVGVPIFLFISGYLGASSHSSIPKKLKSLCVPLIIWGTISYIVSCFIRSRTGNGVLIVGQFIRYILGSGSIYYFVPLLVVCMFLSKYCNRYFLIILSVTSIALSWDVIPHNEIITRYLNPFNFILYYELGKLAREKNIQNANNYLVTIISLIVLIVTGFLWPSIEPCYFNILCIPYVISSFLFIDGVLKLRPLDFLVPIGKYSFVIYLCHIHIAGAVNGRLHGLLEFVKVPIAFVLTCIFVYVLKYFIRKVDSSNKLLVWLGYR